ncbi:probable trehalase isoform X2 [Magnolia sinica]|uniref:probable trehalase isoform X2 n=1 Tax=Magnolia sinica TaxID=86752 RepID=UPI002657C33C|nr:probable trehalase isoform X2 [Magnolia sinica]
MPTKNPNLLSLFFSLIMAAATGLCPDSGPVKPSTPLISFLERLQATALRTLGPTGFDPKLYVDLPLKFDLATTEAAFSKLPRSENGSVSVRYLEGFLGKYMGVAGSDLVAAEPGDFVPVPEGFLPKVESPEVRAWALEVHSLWKNLSRKVSEEILEKRDLHTLLPLPERVIIPGSRFREVYYWDSYWVIRGLLASKMYDTAKAIVNNLISLLDEYGYVLNGARTYYTNRSQPPLLSSMISEIYKKTGDVALVKRALPSLLKEHHFWNSGIHKVNLQDAEGCNHSMSRYYAMWNKPRPESATIDEAFASRLSSASEKEHLYRQLASTAESGWDFSSRWMRNSPDITTLATTSIIPVDLNAYILKMELDMAFFARVVGENSIAEKFSAASKARHASMNSIFWNAEMKQWLDYWVGNDSECKETHRWEGHNQNQNIFASNFIPLWIDLFSSDGLWLVKWSGVGILGRVRVASRPKN